MNSALNGEGALKWRSPKAIPSVELEQRRFKGAGCVCGAELNKENKDSRKYSSAFPLKTEGRVGVGVGKQCSEYLQVGEERKANKKVIMEERPL